VSSIRETESYAGLIVGEATSNEFYFASRTEEYPPKWEYIVVKSQEIVDGEPRDVDVLAQVERITSSSQVLSKDVDLEALEKIKHARMEDVKTWGKARILGFINEEEGATKILLPRRAVVPGHPIYVAPKELLTKFYSYPSDEGLYIGNLITRHDVPVYLSLKGFRRHAAIIAQTGAGKSYCAGVLIEELLKKGATVIVIDPHADYVLLHLNRDKSRHNLTEHITVFRNPSSTGRYADKELGNVKPYEIAFSDLSLDEICDIAGIREAWSNIKEAVRVALDHLKDTHYSPADLLKTLEKMSEFEEAQKEKGLVGSAKSAQKYIRAMGRLKVFGISTTPIEDILTPMRLSVLDLSGLNDGSVDYIAYRALNDIFDEVSSGRFGYPVFAVIEEAHKLIPPHDYSSSLSSSIINKIAAEGRKFGVFLVLISQRPSKIDPDSLSQCNSQIVMKLTNPQDQEAVAASSERMSASLIADLPGLNPGEAVVVGELTRTPVMIQVRQRQWCEGGGDIEIVEKLKEARSSIHADSIINADLGKREPFRGSKV